LGEGGLYPRTLTPP